MSTPFVATVQIFAFNFAPTGWALASGQLLPISQNTALFSLLGTTYGGDGKATFALPNMNGNAAVSSGQGNGLSPYFLGEETGSENVALLTSEIPVHSHGFVTTSNKGTTQTAGGNQLAHGFAGAKTAGFNAFYLTTNPSNNAMVGALSLTGGGIPHNNMQPYLTLNFCIALQGIFPARP